KQRLLARWQLDLLQRDFIDQPVERVVRWQIDARTPEDLSVIFGERQLMRIVRGDPAHPRAHGEGYLHHLVEGRLVAGGARRTVICAVIDVLRGGPRLEHAAAAGAKHVPGKIEEPDARGMQKGGDGWLLAEARIGGESQDVDAAELAILPVPDQALDRAYGVG